MIRQPAKLFRSKALELEFRKNGFVVVPLLADNTVQQLERLFNQYVKESLPNMLYTSHNRNLLETNLAVSNAIIDATKEALDNYFENFRPFLGHFISKSANNNYEFALHQDWSITNEHKYAVAHIWMPLQDTQPENGGMYVVPESHRFFINARSGSLGIPRISRQEGFEEILSPVNVKAGHALVYHPALFHGSYPNSTNADRKVVLLSILQQDAPALYYHVDVSSNRQILYKINEKILLEQLTNLEKGLAPTTKQVHKIESKPDLINENIGLEDLKQKQKTISFHRVLLKLLDRVL